MGRADRRMYPEDLAIRVMASGEKSYRPSNGTEGDMFSSRWCADCVKDIPDLGVYCDIIAQAMCLDVSDPNYPPEWTHDASGQPCCTAFDEATR